VSFFEDEKRDFEDWNLLFQPPSSSCVDITLLLDVSLWIFDGRILLNPSSVTEPMFSDG